MDMLRKMFHVAIREKQMIECHIPQITGAHSGQECSLILEGITAASTGILVQMFKKHQSKRPELLLWIIIIINLLLLLLSIYPFLGSIMYQLALLYIVN